jgi:translation initiation factor IF-1
MKGDRETIEIQGVALEEFRGGLYRVQVGPPLDRVVLARLCGRMERHGIRVLDGDTVTVEVSPYDLSRGRITFRGQRRDREGAA